MAIIIVKRATGAVSHKTRVVATLRQVSPRIDALPGLSRNGCRRMVSHAFTSTATLASGVTLASACHCRVGHVAHYYFDLDYCTRRSCNNTAKQRWQCDHLPVNVAVVVSGLARVGPASFGRSFRFASTGR